MSKFPQQVQGKRRIIEWGKAWMVRGHKRNDVEFYPISMYEYNKEENKLIKK